MCHHIHKIKNKNKRNTATSGENLHFKLENKRGVYIEFYFQFIILLVRPICSAPDSI